jgi:Tfp pilus assembly protein FimT
MMVCIVYIKVLFARAIPVFSRLLQKSRQQEKSGRLENAKKKPIHL